MNDEPIPQHGLNQPHTGLKNLKDARLVTWDDIKDRPLRDIIDLGLLPEKPPGHFKSDTSFQATIRAARSLPVEQLRTEDLVAVTSGLLHNLREEPSPYDWEYVLITKLAWKKHLEAVRDKQKPLAANRQEIVRLADSIEKIIPRSRSTGEALNLEWTTKADLREILTNLDETSTYLLPRKSDIATQEDDLLHWAQQKLKGAKIKMGYDSTLSDLRYSIELPAQLHGTNHSEIIKKLNDSGSRFLSASARIIKVVPDEYSPLAAVLETLSKTGRTLG